MSRLSNTEAARLVPNALLSLEIVQCFAGDSAPAKNKYMSQLLINAVSDAFCDLAGRKLYYRNDITERVHSEGTTVLWMREGPIASVTRVERLLRGGSAEPVDISNIAIGYNEISFDEPLISSRRSSFAGRTYPGYRVTYSAGYRTPIQSRPFGDDPVQALPSDIIAACISSYHALVQKVSSNISISSRTERDQTTALRDRLGMALTPEAMKLAMRYQVESH